MLPYAKSFVGKNSVDLGDGLTGKLVASSRKP